MKKEMQNGARIYSKSALFIYDFFVLKFSNSFAWKCPSKKILELYNQYISANHLDIGVGTGYFLDKCIYPSEPKITLLDLNPNTLEVSAKRIRRYHPETYQADILQPLSLSLPHFDSIGINYLLHCLPGDISTKEIVFKNVTSLLNNKGVVFGSTILGDTAKANFLARKLLSVYNQKKIMSNANDSRADVEAVLARYFRTYTCKQEGHVLLFSAQM